MALTREKILDAAFNLLNQYGLADLSMRRLATELGVAPGGLYYHVKNKQELLASLASRMMDGIALPQPGALTPANRAVEITAVFKGLYRTLIGVKEAPEVIRLALAFQPQVSRPDQLTFPQDLASALEGLTGADTAWLAAESLLHLSLGFIEQEQTRALLSARPVADQPPASYSRAIGAVLAGFTAPDRPPA